MDVSFKRNLNGNCMAISVTDGRDEDYSVRMVMDNSIPGLLKMEYENLNGRKRLIYDISSRQTLAKILEAGKFRSEHLNRLIYALRNCEDRLKEYLLDMENIIFKPEFIFVDMDRNDYFFCFYPQYGKGIPDDIRGLFDRLVSCIDYGDSRLVRQTFEMNIIVHRDNFSIRDLESQLTKDEEESITIRSYFDDDIDSFRAVSGTLSHSTLPAAHEDIIRDKPETKTQTEQNLSFSEKLLIYLKGRKLKDIIADIDNGVFLRKIKAAGKSEKKISRYEDLNIREQGFDIAEKENPKIEKVMTDLDKDEDELFWKSVVFTDLPESGTTLLKEKVKVKHVLMGTGIQQGSVTEINKYPFSVGKLKDSADMILTSGGVSRMHARICENDSMPPEYYLEDLNSTNGTYLNGVKLEPYSREELKSGDIISFADQEYIFR